MKPFLSKLFDTSDFPARWNCGEWDAFHGWLHILSDVAIWAAYAAIPITLVHFCRQRRREFLFKRIVLLFAAFILSCGTVHLIEAIIFYHPIYRVSGLMKLATAIVSWVTVVVLWRHLPKALELPELRAVNSRLNEELERRRRAERDLDVAHRELRMVSAMVAHDLRNPLATARMMMEVAAANVETTDARSMRARLETVAASLKAMTDTLGTLTDQADREPRAPEQVGMDALMREVEATLSSTLAVTDGELTWGDLPTVVAPRDRLFHILLNLVENGIKHSGDGPPRITVAARQAGESLTIEVADRGPGIPDDERDKVFQARYRAENGKPSRGSGMGLAFCRRMVEDMGGTIEADRNPGGGTIIRFHLPAGSDGDAN